MEFIAGIIVGLFVGVCACIVFAFARFADGD